MPIQLPIPRFSSRSRPTTALAFFFLCLLPAPVSSAQDFDQAHATTLIARAEKLDRLHSLLVLHRGEAIFEHVQAGRGLAHPANLKSLSKTVLSAVAGIAVERGIVASVDQPITDLLGERVPGDATEGVDNITFGGD